MPRRSLTVLTATAVAAATLATITPARADEATDAPVTQDDRVVLRGGGFAFADVLANDSDPNGDPLEICRLEIPDGVPLNHGSSILIAVDSDDNFLFPEPLFLTADRFTPGTYKITYYACDLDYLTPATVTVVVTRTRPVRARKVGPHTVRFTNPDTRPVEVQYSTGMRRRDGGELRLPAGSSKRVRVSGRTVDWFAFARTGSAGSGTVRGHRQGAPVALTRATGWTARELTAWHTAPR